jgi:hypothetical protein
VTASLRHLGRFFGDLGAYAWRTGRWWMPVVTLLLVVVAALVAAAKVIVPTAVYTLF